MSSLRLHAAFLIAALPTLGGCSDASSSVGHDDAHLLARVELKSGGHVAFYEPEPGTVLVRETGPLGAVRAALPDESKLAPDARYARLAGAPAPRALVDAVARSRAARPEQRRAQDPAAETATPPAEVSLTEGSERVGRVEQGLGWMEKDAFRARFCGDSSGSDLMWLNRTGSGNIGQKNDKNWVNSAVRVQRGHARFVFKTKPWYSWREQADVRIDEGYYESVEVWNNIDFDIKGGVSEADGAVYDFCTSYGTGVIWAPADV